MAQAIMADVELLHEEVTAICPLARSRIKKPVKGPQCTHLQSFCGSSFSKMVSATGSGLCPVCNQTVRAAELVADAAFENAMATSPGCSKFSQAADGKGATARWGGLR